MTNSDSDYPLHQPRRGRHNDPSDADTEADDDLERGQDAGELPAPRPRYRTRGPVHQRELPTTPHLPSHHIRNTLIIGVIAGIISALQGIIITLINAPVYNSAKGVAQSNMTLSLAGTLVGLLCLKVFISLLIYFIAGFVTGKIAVERRLGFLAGFIAGALSSILGYLVHQIPQYPDTSSTPGFNGGPGAILGSFVGALILLVIIGLVAAFVSYLGARIATRRHVYYTGYEE